MIGCAIVCYYAVTAIEAVGMSLSHGPRLLFGSLSLSCLDLMAHGSVVVIDLLLHSA